MIEREIWRSDLEFTANHLSATMVRGYQFWAIPYVKLMRRSELAEKIIDPLMIWRAEEVAHKMGKRAKGNWKGKIIRMFGEPVCYAIGLFVPEQDWQKLWNDEKRVEARPLAF